MSFNIHLNRIVESIVSENYNTEDDDKLLLAKGFTQPSIGMFVSHDKKYLVDLNAWGGNPDDGVITVTNIATKEDEYFYSIEEAIDFVDKDSIKVEDFTQTGEFYVVKHAKNDFSKQDHVFYLKSINPETWTKNFNEKHVGSDAELQAWVDQNASSHENMEVVHSDHAVDGRSVEERLIDVGYALKSTNGNVDVYKPLGSGRLLIEYNKLSNKFDVFHFSGYTEDAYKEWIKTCLNIDELIEFVTNYY